MIHSSQCWKQSSMLKLFILASVSLVLSFFSCLLSLTPTVIVVNIYIYIYLMVNWEQLSFQPMLHRTRATQSQSMNPLTICSSSCMQTHSHSTDHSFIHCYYHRHTLSYCYIKIVLINPKGRPCWAPLRLLHAGIPLHCTGFVTIYFTLREREREREGERERGRERERTHFFSENCRPAMFSVLCCCLHPSQVSVCCPF